MSYTNCPRGSEWRKWDLHVHTPCSYLNNQFGSDFDNYVKQLFTKAVEKQIAVIGITDYFTIEGYKKIKKEYLENEAKLKELFDNNDELIGKIKQILILPNVEFRLNKLVGKNRINFHVIFSNDVSCKDIEENFLGEIKFVYEGNPQNEDEQRSLTINNLGALGNKLKKEHEKFRDKSDIEVGMMNAVVDDKDIIKVLNNKKSIFEGKYLLFVPSDEDLSDISWDSQDHNVRKVIIQKCDGFFASNFKTIKWALGKYYEEKENFIKEFKSFKPCIWGSDSHNYEKMFEPDSKRYTWIKADPTFEGLKQIVYEPEDRVRIQEEKPEQKTDYLVIDAVRFLDNRKNPEFSNKWICLNPNLNSIIGGKSSGKSLLLYHIAKTIDPERIDEINKDKEYRRLEYNFEKDPKFDFEVKWSDGETYRLKDSEKKRVRSITYIPQLYLNRLAEEKKDELNQLVDNILLESSLEYKNFRDEQKKKIYEIKEKISTDINKFYEFSEEIKRKEKEKKDIGDKKAIQSNKEKIEKEIENIRANSKFSKEEQEKYKKLFEERTKIKKKILNLEEIIKILNIAKKEIENYNSSFKEKFNLNIVDRVKEQYPTATDDSLKILSTILNSISEKVMAILKQSLEDKFVIIEEKIKELRKLRKEEESLIDELKQFEDKIKNKKRFVELKKQEEEENNKVKKIIELETEIEKLKERRNNLKNSFLENYTNLFKCYQTIVLKNEKHRSISQQDNLELISDIAIKNEKFEKNFLGKIDKRKSLKNQFGNYFSDKGKYLFEPDKHLDNIKDMVKKIIEKKIELNKGFEEKHVINALLDDYFYIDYDIVKEGDKLVNMSPGKMGIILFQLYLHLSKSKNPILIDQPEDNLDNRTVYAELNDFIRKKKIERQIIIVSHNANLVVSTDSENVIVANQSGQETSKDNKKYRFEYVNGSLEHTFYDESQSGILYKKGIREHVCEILEGGKDAFKKRENKYGFKT